MKLVLDTVQKTIKIEESVNLGELIETLEIMLPMGVWKEFTLETNTQIVWKSPIIFKEYIRTSPLYPYPTFPWYNPIPQITYTNEGILGASQLQTGTYCIEV
jgi:hypothetical protein